MQLTQNHLQLQQIMIKGCNWKGDLASIRVEYITNKKMSVKDRTETVIKNNLGKITKREIVEMCPDISEGSIERALRELVIEEKILKITGGRYTKYIYNY